MRSISASTFHALKAQFSMALAWALLVFVGYYLFHKPVALDQVVAASRSVLDLLLAMALTGLAGGIGERLLHSDRLFPLERLAIQAALGLGIMSLAWFAIGLAGFFRPWLAWVLLLSGLWWFRREISHWAGQLRVLPDVWRSSGRFGRILATAACLLVAGQLLFALASPWKWDSLLYHLDLPRRYLEAGRFFFLAENPIWGHPQLVEVLYSWAIALRGLETATTLSWCIGVVLLVGMIGLAVRFTSPTGGLLAASALLCGETFLGELSWGYVDNAAALFGLAALAALLEFSEIYEQRWLNWAGIFAGLAVSVKYTAGILLLAIVAGLALTVPGRIKQKLVWAARITAIASFVILPWLVKNFLATGNPVFPYFIQTSWVTEEQNAFGAYRAETAPPAWQSIGLPLALTWLGVEGGGGFATDIGPLLALLAVPGIIGGWQNQSVRMVGAFLATGWLAMAVGSYYSVLLHQARLFFVLLPASGLAAAWGWSAVYGLQVASIRFRRILMVFTLLALGFSIWQQSLALIRMNPAASLLGLETREDYQDRMLGQYAPAMRHLFNLPDGSRVLFLWEPRTLFAPVTAVADPWTDRWYVERKTIGDPVQILHGWRAKGFTHLLVFDLGADFEREIRPEFSQEDWQALDGLLDGLPPPLRFGSAYSLYHITP